MDKITAKAVRAPFQKAWTELDYFRFCELLDFDPKYSVDYWQAFQALSNGLAKFDDSRLQKILDFGKES